MIKLYLGAETNTVSSKKGDLDGNQEKSNKEKSNKEKSNKEKSNKEKSKSEKKIIKNDFLSFGPVSYTHLTLPTIYSV